MSKVISDTKEHIQKIYPEARDVEIRVERAPAGEFVSKIHVRSRAGIIHAAKKAASYRESIDRSFHAVLRQIERIRQRRKKRQKLFTRSEPGAR